MPRTLLIPTDFTIESLIMLKYAAAVEDAEFEELNIVLLHCTHLTDSITDLLFYSPAKIIDAELTKDFIEACNILRNKFPRKFRNIHIKLFHGKTKSAFAQFLEANNVDEVIIPAKYQLKLKKNAFSPIPYILKHDLPVRQVEWREKKNHPEKNRIAELFVD